MKKIAPEDADRVRELAKKLASGTIEHAKVYRLEHEFCEEMMKKYERKDVIYLLTKDLLAWAVRLRKENNDRSGSL